MSCASSRALFDSFEGILNGMGELFNRQIKVTVTPLDKTRARAEIRFLEPERPPVAPALFSGPAAAGGRRRARPPGPREAPA